MGNSKRSSSHCRDRPGYLPPHAAAQLCQPFIGKRSRLAGDPGDAGALGLADNGNLYPCGKRAIGTNPQTIPPQSIASSPPAGQATDIELSAKLFCNSQKYLTMCNVCVILYIKCIEILYIARKVIAYYEQKRFPQRCY